MKRRWKCALLLVFALAAPCALALNPALDINQFGHFAWRIRDGFLKGAVRSIAQTADGYLWLGTEFGLYRFDGVRPVAFQPPRDQHLPSDSISALLAARDGTLWIGAYKGLASWKDGKLNQYPQLAGQDVPRILEDREGAVWAGGVAIPAGRLCQIQRERMQCYGEDGLFGYGVFGLFEDRRGDLWAGALHGIWHWKPGPPKFHSLPNGTNAVRGFADEGNGTLLVGVQDGILRFADGKSEAYPLRGPGQPFYAKTLLRDRDGGIWIGTGRGLLHSHEARTDWFGPSDGLSGDDTDDLFEDREGNVWVATPGGLDRFRDFAIARFSENQGVPNLDSTPVLAARDGSIWVGTGGGLIRLNHADVTAYTDRGAKAVRGIQEVTGSGLPTRGIQSLFQDSRGRIWIAAESGFGYLELDRWVSIRGVPSGAIYSIAEDAVGSLWLAHEQRGLLRLFRDGEVQQTPWAQTARKDVADALAADVAGGGVWIGFYSGDVIYFAKRIEVEIRYALRQFRLCIRDNGRGIDPAVLSAGGRAGHHGLPGIHERAELAGGKLAVRSKLNSGTEIELIIPAGIAYLKSSPPPKSRTMIAGEGNG